jgi:hypothetical protein
MDYGTNKMNIFNEGASLTAFGGVSIIQWQWWVIIVPTIVLMNFLEKEE